MRVLRVTHARALCNSHFFFKERKEVVMGRIRTSREPRLSPYTVEAEVQEALDNWGRWSAPRYGYRGSTSPMFRLFRSRDRHEDSAPRAICVPVDPDAAWKAEKVICNPGFLPRARHLLTAHYVFEADMRNTCRALGLARREYDMELWSGSYFFWNRYKNA